MLRELNADLLKYSISELNENPEKLQDDISNVKNWILKQPRLKARTDDQWIVGFLRACKFSLERVKNKMQLYYSLQTSAPEIVFRMQPADESFRQFFKLGCCVVLPASKEKLMPRLILLRMGNFDASVNHITDIICLLYYLIKVLIIEDDISTILGVKVIVDYKGMTAAHWSQATPTTIKKIILVCQDSMPFRAKGSHHINMSSGIEIAFNIAKSLMNEKSKRRMVIHKKPEELMDHFPSDIIPAEYGGTGPQLASIIDDWLKKIEKYQDFYKEEKEFGIIEDGKRENITASSAFGVDGSFRALQID